MASTQLRFNSEKQKKAIQKIAKNNKRSMNAELIIAIDKHISSYDTFPVYGHPEIQKQSNKKVK